MDAPDLPDPFAYRQALEAGWTRAALDAALRDGDVIWLRHGWYSARRDPADGEVWEKVAEDHRHRLRLALARHPGHVASHASAALVHGFAVSLAGSSPVHLTCVDREPRSRREPGVELHHSDSTVNVVAMVDGTPVTTPTRTVADYLRTQALPVGLGLLDDALRHGRVELGAVRRVLETQRRWRGRPRALGALGLADPVRESWAESFTFAHLHLQGVPIPVHQVEVLDERCRFVARVDGLWAAAGVVGECDGLEKYLWPEGSPRSPEDRALTVLGAEQRRQARLEALGLAVVRWSPAQVRDDPGAVASRVKRALRLADPDRFVGWVVHEGRRHRLPLEVQTPELDLEALRRRRPRTVRRTA